jgi:hypothetical protein
VNNLEASKTAAQLSSGDIATNATHQHAIDTLGFDYASIDVVFEPVAAAGTNSSVAVALKLQQGDTTSSYDDVTAFVGGGSGGFTVPTPADTNSSTVVRFNVDMRGKQRFLNVFATPNVVSPVVSVARLGKPEEAPVAASDAGVAVFVSG